VITDGLVQCLRTWLGDEGLGFFRACKKYMGRVDPVFVIREIEDAALTDEIIKRMAEEEKQRNENPHEQPPGYVPEAGMIANARPPGIPHPVHFREGMRVRNYMRTLPACKGWNQHDLENTWVEAIEKAIA